MGVLILIAVLVAFYFIWASPEDEEVVARRKAATEQVIRETAARKQAREAEQAAQRKAEAERRARREQQEADRRRKQAQEAAKAAAAKAARAQAAAEVKARQDAIEERKRQNRELNASIRAQYDAERAERRRLDAERTARSVPTDRRVEQEGVGWARIPELRPMMFKHKVIQTYSGISDDFTAVGGHTITLCGIRVGSQDDPAPEGAPECSACLFAEQARSADPY